MYTAICPVHERGRGLASWLFKLANPVMSSQMNGLRGILLAEVSLKRLEIWIEVQFINNVFRDSEMENGDRLQPLQRLVLHGYA